jgi:hypothetical protein
MFSKKENICELSILGAPKKEENLYLNSRLQIEELCENSFIGYDYEITTFKLETGEGYKTLHNLVELHHNKNKFYER